MKRTFTERRGFVERERERETQSEKQRESEGRVVIKTEPC